MRKPEPGAEVGDHHQVHRAEQDDDADAEREEAPDLRVPGDPGEDVRRWPCAQAPFVVVVVAAWWSSW